MRYSSALRLAAGLFIKLSETLPDKHSSDCSAVRYPPPSVLSPPTDGYQGHNFADWVPPPPEHLYGVYHLTFTSYVPVLSALSNLRIERYPVFSEGDDHPAGSEAEICSWSTCATHTGTGCRYPDEISTVFGYNEPIGAQGPTDKTYAAAWEYRATGYLDGKTNGRRAVVAWGEDDGGFDYIAQYETSSNIPVNLTKAQEAIINLASRNPNGISHKTYTCLSSSLKQLAEELGDDEMSAAISRLQPLHFDNRRDTDGPAECDSACVRNEAYDVDSGTKTLHKMMNGLQFPLVITGVQMSHFRRAGNLPWWGWMTLGLVFGIPLLGGLFVAVPVAVCKGHRRRQLARAERANRILAEDNRRSSVAEPEMARGV